MTPSALTKPDDMPENESDTDSEEFYDTQDSPASKKNAEIERILSTLGLTEKIKTKIKISDVIQMEIYDNESKIQNNRDIPYIFLQRLCSGNSDAMNYRSFKNMQKTYGKVRGSVQAMYQPKESDSISPQDLFFLVYQCCDPMLKQLLFLKLNLCKIAFPFLLKEYQSAVPRLALWPLRSLVVETKQENGSSVNKMKEFELLELPINVVSFARFGRPSFSKSKLLNGILCQNGSETFFHKDRPLGNSTRYSTAGNVEMFYLPIVNGVTNMFGQPIMFLNLRGDLKHDFDDNVSEFISTLSDTIAIVVDSVTFQNNITLLKETIARFTAVVLICSGPLGPRDGKIFRTLRKLEKLVLHYHSTTLNIISTHSEVDEKNYAEIIAETTDALSESLIGDTESLGTRLKKTSIETDETDICNEAFKSANTIIESMEEIAEPEHWTEEVTPIQSSISQQLGRFLKELHSENDLTSLDDIIIKIRDARDLSKSMITSSVNLFSRSLIDHENDPVFLEYFLSWIKILLDRKKRIHIQTNIKPTVRIAGRTSDMAESLKKGDNAYLEIGHLFREIGHICDSVICLNISHKEIDFPAVEDTAKVIANLVSVGYTLELLDGNSFYMPTEWIKLVLGLLHENVGKAKVLTLSVLGIQSSGKSTLLNTMFGLKFPTSSGRCTRGIHMQLIPVSHDQQKISAVEKPFKYVLVIDTEGVRAPELVDTGENYLKRDNELSTIITGLGDITMLNVMGEGSSEMRDILQILAHAFLRLKLANNRLDIRKSCFFIHQNVFDMRASEKMELGLVQTIKYLDQATKEAADFEGIADITTFSQVIEFDTESHVWYLPNCWQGNPPMASVNQKYCNKVVHLNNYLIQKATHEQDKSFKTIEDTFLHIDDLWKGVLAESFVFSFRNSIEKKAYIEFEMRMKDELWTLECSTYETILRMANNRFTQCDDVLSLSRAKKEMIAELTNIISGSQSKTMGNMETFFTENNYKDITIKWKEYSLNHIRVFCQGMISNRRKDIDLLSKNREVDIMISIECIKHEEQLRSKSFELAKELRLFEKAINMTEANKRFEEIWNTFVETSLSTDFSKNFEPRDSMKKYFLDCINDRYVSHRTALTPILHEYSYLDKKLEIKTLAGSFDKTGISENHISLVSPLKHLGGKVVKNIKTGECQTARENIESMFCDIDIKVKQICQKNREITDQDVKQFLNYVDYLIRNSLKQNVTFTPKITCIVRVVVHVSCFACNRFEKENSRYQQSQGITVRLAMYKKQVHESFIAHLMQHKTEDTAATLMRHTIEEYTCMSVKNVMSVRVGGELRHQLPVSKYYLLIEILTSLVKEKSCSLFMRYILSPKEYDCLWITDKAEQILFSEHSKLYKNLAEHEISRCITDINKSLKDSTENIPEHTTIDSWIQRFISLLSTLKIPRESFRNVVRELERTDSLNIPEFRNKVIEELKGSANTILKVFETASKNTIKWNHFNPVEKICSEIWGCPEQCIFCGEPCTRAFVHYAHNSHNCLQHRPLGCFGLFDERNGKIILQSCNVDIMKVQCSVIDFRCNPQNREPCGEKWHSLKEYKNFAPGWDIEPSHNMEQRAKFWMWFIGKYDKEIGKYHNCDVTNVPKSWKQIHKKEALRSLDMFARGKGK